MRRVPYIGPVMFTESQCFYLREVLGVSVESYWAQVVGTIATRSGAGSGVSGPTSDLLVPTIFVLVQTPPLNSEERALLRRILSSIQLEHFHHVESATPEQLEGGVSARHILVFSEGVDRGRYEAGGCTWWRFHPLANMVGTSSAVTQAKKAVWNLLQVLRTELQQLEI
ncbi:MAG: hypothetical protein AB7G93_21990 [Bdellovibrionales bacterium]